MQFISRNLMSRPGVQLRDIPRAQGEATSPPDPELPPDPVVAQFVGNPLSGYAPLTVNFTDQSTGDPDTWGWNMGEGLPSVSTLQNPVWVYNTPGLYSVSLTAVRSSDGASDTEFKPQYIEVLAPPSGGGCQNRIWFAEQGPKSNFNSAPPPALLPSFLEVLNGTVGNVGFLQAIDVWGLHTFEPATEPPLGWANTTAFTYDAPGGTGTATITENTVYVGAGWPNTSLLKTWNGNAEVTDRSVGRYNMTPGLPNFPNGRPDWGWWLEATATFSYSFSIPISTFGVYITDAGDFGGNCTIELYSGATLVHSVTMFPDLGTQLGNGSLAFFGIQRATPFDRVRFVITQGGGQLDVLGFDQIYVGGCAGA